ncbi:MAG: DUF1553 domain-containing protein, partial [Verrucomicrobiae bacterium]|nr:DUF1553 domain-containing protein [Verrucomicrobiae bacterium]
MTDFYKPLSIFLGAMTVIGGTAFSADSAAVPAAPEKPPVITYADQVRQMMPVAWWSFESEKQDLGEVEGSLTLGKPGPTAKDFQSFAAGNRAALFGSKDGKAQGFIRVEDPGAGSQFDFDNGDPITIEAWVNPDADSPKNGNMYVLGKGRTSNPGEAANNQNYGFRLFESGGFLKLSWLFRSRAEGDQPQDWHRWDSSSGFKSGSGWHHVAISYVFGDPDSVRGFIDGERVEGMWNPGYAGATKRPPVVDDDDIWVGTSGGKGAAVTFHGLLDEVALYRRTLSEEQLTDRFPVEPYTPPIPAEGITEGKVRVEIIEDLGKIGKWPRRFPKPSLAYDEEVFGFFQVPQKYIEAGVRGDWTNPFMIRAAAKVTLPAGEQRLLLRSRGKSRLWLDGKVIAENEFGNFGGGAHNEIAETEKVTGKDLRYLGPGDRETLIKVTGDGKEHLLVLEMIAGNGRVRATLGETTVSWQQADESFVLLSPGTRVVPLTDDGWESYRRERNEYYPRLNQELRLVLRENEDAYWQKRHARASEAIAAKPKSAGEGIDAILEAGWAKTNAELAEVTDGIRFSDQIKPLLAENCYRCHEEKTKGGLRLSTREGALKGGDSEMAAIVPGKPEESLLLELIHPDAGDDIMPPKGDPLTESDRQLIAQWIREGASYAESGTRIEPAKLTSDLEFLRRVTLDTIGVVPSADEIAAFLADDPENRRSQVIDRLLADARWADHWTSYWQDVLAENPNILKPSLNNSGPFRFWIHEALLDNLAMDRFVTELIMMKGSVTNGGPAGFGMAAQNDVPMAAKAHILSTAFLGVEMKCARCHDAPYHESKQKDLFQLAAMLKQETLKLPESSSVPMSTFAGRKPLIEITLKPGEMIAPAWPEPFSEAFLTEVDPSLLRDPRDSRERLAALITSPENERFPQVIVNRIWKQFLGAGIVDPVDDWEASKPSHPELLAWLSRELVANAYDLKHVSRLILNSEAYQREAHPLDPGMSPDFSFSVQRRMTAEQVVDSLFASVGKDLESEELTMDNDGTQVEKTMISLGFPKRAWEFTSLSNERDRPSLAIPKAQAIVDV